ncbi:unnamed protein product, partial [Clonostachys chloroleuca]
RSSAVCIPYTSWPRIGVLKSDALPRPNCQQCSNDPANCQYPEQSRRGIPIGFINRLEARLAETEHALHRLLQYIDEGTFYPSNLAQTPDQSKADRVKEWDSFPLESMMDIRRWHEQHVGTATPASGTHSSQQNLSPHELAWQPGHYSQSQGPDLSPASPFNNVPNLVSQSEVIGPPVDLNPAPATLIDPSWGNAPQASEGKAKELSKNRPNLYF